MGRLNEVIGLNVRRRREELGLSQRELCRRAKLSSAFLCGLESGKRGLTVENLSSIARVLGRKLDWFARDPSDAYGRCPHCGGRCVLRERRINGNDTCINGHVYPSSSSVEVERGKSDGQ